MNTTIKTSQCRGCGRKMLHTRWFPGAVVHNARGLCQSCYQGDRQREASSHRPVKPAKEPRTSQCCDCQRPIVRGTSRGVSAGYRLHAANGRCRSCDVLARRKGMFAPAPLTTEEVIEEYEHLRTAALSNEQIAARLGMSVSTLDKHLKGGHWSRR